MAERDPGAAASAVVAEAGSRAAALPVAPTLRAASVLMAPLAAGAGAAGAQLSAESAENAAGARLPPLPGVVRRAAPLGCAPDGSPLLPIAAREAAGDAAVAGGGGGGIEAERPALKGEAPLAGRSLSMSTLGTGDLATSSWKALCTALLLVEAPVPAAPAGERTSAMEAPAGPSTPLIVAFGRGERSFEKSSPMA